MQNEIPANKNLICNANWLSRFETRNSSKKKKNDILGRKSVWNDSQTYSYMALNSIQQIVASNGFIDQPVNGWCTKSSNIYLQDKSSGLTVSKRQKSGMVSWLYEHLGYIVIAAISAKILSCLLTLLKPEKGTLVDLSFFEVSSALLLKKYLEVNHPIFYRSSPGPD